MEQIKKYESTQLWSFIHSFIHSYMTVDQLALMPPPPPSNIRLGDGSSKDVFGKAFVVHEKEDDLGTAGTTASMATGSAGARVGCGVINLVSIGR